MKAAVQFLGYWNMGLDEKLAIGEGGQTISERPYIGSPSSGCTVILTWWTQILLRPPCSFNHCVILLFICLLEAKRCPSAHRREQASRQPTMFPQSDPHNCFSLSHRRWSQYSQTDLRARRRGRFWLTRRVKMLVIAVMGPMSKTFDVISMGSLIWQRRKPYVVQLSDLRSLHQRLPTLLLMILAACLLE